MKPLEQEAQEIFKAHPNLNKVYITSDGIGYEREHNANQHAKTLDDKTVTPFTREQFPAETEGNGTNEVGGNDENPSDKEQGNDNKTTQVGSNDELNEGDVQPKEVVNPKEQKNNKNKKK